MDEFGDNEQINSYALDLAIASCGCVADLVLANQTITQTQTLKATSTATLGPNLMVNGTDITVNAPTVSILGGTSINGSFSVANNPTCP